MRKTNNHRLTNGQKVFIEEQMFSDHKKSEWKKDIILKIWKTLITFMSFVALSKYF